MENNMTISCLRQLLDEDSNRLMSAEIDLKRSLGVWMNDESSPDLKIIMYRYLDMIERHLKYLESFAEEEQVKSFSISNRVIKAFIDEINEKLAACSCPQVKNACVLAGIQGINHFKISPYGTAAAFADAAGLYKAATLFHQAEKDEKSIDEDLSHLAAHQINKEALAPVVLNT